MLIDFLLIKFLQIYYGLKVAEVVPATRLSSEDIFSKVKNLFIQILPTVHISDLKIGHAHLFLLSYAYTCTHSYGKVADSLQSTK